MVSELIIRVYYRSVYTKTNALVVSEVARN
jgi:hypothetical protein